MRITPPRIPPTIPPIAPPLRPELPFETLVGTVVAAVVDVSDPLPVSKNGKLFCVFVTVITPWPARVVEG